MSGIIMGKPGEEFQEHQYKRHNFGTKMVIGDRTWVYAQMGGSTGVAGNVYQSEVPTAHWTSMAVDTARAVGAVKISATLGSTATVQDEFDEGYVGIEDDAGEGFLYPIARAYAAGDANAKASASAVQTVNLASGYSVVVALTTSTTLSFIKHKLDEVIIHPSPATAIVVGVAMKAVTASYYCWLQIKGPAMVLADGTLVLTSEVIASDATNGAVEARNYTLSEATPNTLDGTQDEPSLGTVIDIGATTEYAMIDLDIPGY